MIPLNIQSESSRLQIVVLGTAKRNGTIPKIENCYDPKSIQHILEGTYPIESALTNELNALVRVFNKYNIEVYRPNVIEGVNQIFARDIAFVIEDTLVRSNILPHREKELIAVDYIFGLVAKSKQVILPENCHVEGGDVMVYKEYIFIGTYLGEEYPDLITARTNSASLDAIQELFPNKIVKAFQLRKSNSNPMENALHLDCCFNPLGRGKALIHKASFLVEKEYHWLVRFFGKENIFEITTEEMCMMTSNVFSIDEHVVVSEKNFVRLNSWLRKNDFIVEEVPYAEIGKLGGLLRCTTLPLFRD